MVPPLCNKKNYNLYIGINCKAPDINVFKTESKSLTISRENLTIVVMAFDLLIVVIYLFWTILLD